MSKCKKCDQDSWSIVDRKGALEIWRCNNCGAEELIHVNDASIASLLPSHLEPVFLILGKWRTKPSLEAVVDAKKSFRALKDMSNADLIRYFRGDSYFELGRFTESELTGLKDKFLGLGIEVKRKSI